jgi:Tfp pilus assembly protein FimT
MSHSPRSGQTLVELATVLVLVAVGASTLAPTARRLGDRAAVMAAREEVVRALAQGRMTAVSRGGATVTVVADPPEARVGVPGVVLRRVPLDGGSRRIRVRLTGGRDSLTLRFDRLGIGRFANGTVLLQRGDATAGLVISSYGRIRRR